MPLTRCEVWATAILGKLTLAYRSYGCARTAILFFLFACFLADAAFGLDPSKKLEQYVVRTWTSQQQLPQNSVRAMVQTRDGFLWIGTRGGLARFDGIGFIVYRASASSSIPNDAITGLAEDRDGSLWIASEGGLARYRAGHFQTFNRRFGLAGASIYRITADPAGGLWAVTLHSQLFHFDGVSEVDYPSPMGGQLEECNAILADPHSTLWIATFHGLFSFQPGKNFRRFTQKDGLAGDRVFALALDRHGDIWAAGEGGISHHRVTGFMSQRVPGLHTATILSLERSQDEVDTIWTGSTRQGLFRLTRSGVQRLRASQGLVSDEIYMLYLSREGSLWLGAVNGLNQLSDSALTSFSANQGMPPSTLGMQVSAGPDGHLWFGVNKKVFQVHDGALVPFHAETPVIKDEPIGDGVAKPQEGAREARSVPVVRSNSFKRFGLILSDRLHHDVLSKPRDKRSDLRRIPWKLVGEAQIDSKGTMWVGGPDIGLRAYPILGPPRFYTTADGLSDNNVRALAEDGEGNVWVGTISGLDRISNGVASHVVSCVNLTSISASTDGSVWAGSESGLIYVPPALSPVRVFTQKDNLPTNLIEGVAEDEDDRLWLGTQRGIVLLDKQSLLSPDSKRPITTVTFDTNDGLHNAQLRDDSIFRGDDGQIWFMTLQELATINPGPWQSHPLNPAIIDRVAIDDRPTDTRAVLRVPPGRHQIKISFTLPEFRSPTRILFRYKLDGWDKDWRDAGTLRDATYSGIPPGNYSFRIVNSDGYGKWTSRDLTLPIQVTPSFYQRAWFLSLMAILPVVALWWIHEQRKKQIRDSVSSALEERLKERARIARDLHDNLLQSMIAVSMQLFAASKQTGQEIPTAHILDQASSRLRQIAEQGRQTLDDLRFNSADLKSLDAMIRLMLEDFNLPDGLQLSVENVGAPIQLLPLVQGEVGQIARQAVANAIQHSGANSIQIYIRYHPRKLILSISDDGCGIDPQIQSVGVAGHWGLVGMHERAAGIGGTLRILPHLPRGLTIELALLGALAYLAPSRRQHTLYSRLQHLLPLNRLRRGLISKTKRIAQQNDLHP